MNETSGDWQYGHATHMPAYYTAAAAATNNQLCPPTPYTCVSVEWNALYIQLIISHLRRIVGQRAGEMICDSTLILLPSFLQNK